MKQIVTLSVGSFANAQLGKGLSGCGGRQKLLWLQGLVDRDGASFAGLNGALRELIPVEFKRDGVQPRRYLNPRRRELSGGIPIHDDFCALRIAAHLRPSDARG